MTHTYRHFARRLLAGYAALAAVLFVFCEAAATNGLGHALADVVTWLPR